MEWSAQVRHQEKQRVQDVQLLERCVGVMELSIRGGPSVLVAGHGYTTSPVGRDHFRFLFFVVGRFFPLHRTQHTPAVDVNFKRCRVLSTN